MRAAMFVLTVVLALKPAGTLAADPEPLRTVGLGEQGATSTEVTWVGFSADGPAELVKVGDEAVKVGKLAAERLADLSKHDYRLEPNVTITPDNKWVVFRSNMHGPTHVYAVEVAKAR